MGIREIFKVTIMSEMMVMMIAQLCTFSKNHWIVCFTQVNFMACKLYLNKAAKRFFLNEVENI